MVSFIVLPYINTCIDPFFSSNEKPYTCLKHYSNTLDPLEKYSLKIISYVLLGAITNTITNSTHQLLLVVTEELVRTIDLRLNPDLWTQIRLREFAFFLD